MADVTIVNNSGQTVSLRLDDETDRGRDMLDHFRKMYRQGDFQSLEVEGETAAPTPKRAPRGKSAT